MRETESQKMTQPRGQSQEGGACALWVHTAGRGGVDKKGCPGVRVVLSPALSQCCVLSQHYVDIGWFLWKATISPLSVRNDVTS